MKNLTEITDDKDIVTKDFLISHWAALDVTYTANTKTLEIDVTTANSADNTEY